MMRISTTTTMKKSTFLIVIAIACIVFPGVGWGFSRRDSVRDFTSNSTGLNNLNINYQPANGGGVLGSSIYGQQRSNIKPVHISTNRYQSRPYSTAPRQTTTHRRYAPGLPTPTAAPTRRSGGYAPRRTVSPGSDYAGVKGVKQRKLPKDIFERVITSLVPPEPAKHRETMLKGEQAFKKGEYAEALAYFETARQISNNSPESLLSLARASFAMADGSYAKPAEYLARTLEIDPELPQIHIFPKSFYGKQSDYIEQMKKLEDYVKTNPKDPQAQLVLGYIRWRQGKPDESRKALGIALADSKDPHITKAVKILLSTIGKGKDFVKPPEMAKAEAYPWAGLQLALPKGFEQKTPDQTYQVLNAAKTGNGEPVIVALSAFSVETDTTPSGIADHLISMWRAKTTVDEFTLVEERDVTIAGLPAIARMFTYTVRGDEASALVMCAIREIKGKTASDGALRIGYNLLVRTTRKNMLEMIGVINGVSNSTELIELARPIDLPIELSKHSIRDIQGEYTVRIPNGWTAYHDQDGVVLEQIDYLIGGVASPSVNVISLGVPEGMTAKACGESALAFAAEKRGHKVKILEQGPATIGQQDGYQFVVEKRLPLESEEGEPKKFGDPFIRISRMLAGPVVDGRKTYYVIMLTLYDCDMKRGESIMDKLADGFMLVTK